MSGWIKFEKDLQIDPRVLRMAKALDRRLTLFDGPQSDYDPCNAAALPAVTLVCGALVRLWSLADSHVGEDDVLDLSADEVDDYIGIPGFCQIMPADWMQVGDGVVKLPGFHAHNGTAAKKRAVTQNRVAAHRTRNAESVTRPRPRPDQDQTNRGGGVAAVPAAPSTAPELTLTGEPPDPVLGVTPGPNRRAKRGALSHFVPETWTVPMPDYRWAREQGYSAEFLRRETERFCDHEFRTPKSDWTRAWRNWITRDPPKGGRNGQTFRAA